MNKACPRAAIIALLLLICIGTGAITLTFWSVTRPQAIIRSWGIALVSFGVFFISFTLALLLYLRWRDGKRALNESAVQSTTLSQQDLEGTIYRMTPGDQYQVIKSFTDFYGNSFAQGEVLRFRERHFLPYHGGHTIVFDERPLSLQEDTNREILENFSEYLVKLVQ